MLSEVRHNVLAALNVNKDGRIELAEFARSVPTCSHSHQHLEPIRQLLSKRGDAGAAIDPNTRSS